MLNRELIDSRHIFHPHPLAEFDRFWEKEQTKPEMTVIMDCGPKPCPVALIGVGGWTLNTCSV